MDNQPIDQQPTEQNTDPQNIPQPQFNAPEPIAPPTFSTEPAPMQPSKKSKKKLIIILIIIAILLIGGGVTAFVLLSPKKTLVLSPKSSPTDEMKSTATTPTLSKTANVDSGLPVTFSPSFLNITMNAPRYNSINQGFAKVFDNNILLIILNHNAKIVAVSDEEINNYLQQDLKGVLLYLRAAKDFLRLKIENSEKRIINGYETLRFEGKAIFVGSNDKKEFLYHTVGYTFSIDGIPAQLIGIVTDNAQKQSDIDQLVKDIDGMINTMRVRGRP